MPVPRKEDFLFKWPFHYTLVFTALVLCLFYYLDAPLKVMIYAAFVYPGLHLVMNILRK